MYRNRTVRAEAGPYRSSSAAVGRRSAQPLRRKRSRTPLAAAGRWRRSRAPTTSSGKVRVTSRRARRRELPGRRAVASNFDVGSRRPHANATASPAACRSSYYIHPYVTD